MALVSFLECSHVGETHLFSKKQEDTGENGVSSFTRDSAPDQEIIELKELLTMNDVKEIACDLSLRKFMEELGFKLVPPDISVELLRYIRLHACKLLDISEEEERKLQLSASHFFSRRKVKYDAKREDSSVMHSISLNDQLDVDINAYFTRIREMYSWHFPELFSLIRESLTDTSEMQEPSTTAMKEYLDAIKIVGDRKSAHEEEIRKHPKGKEIIDAMKTTIGGDIAEADLLHINSVIQILISKISLKEKTVGYLAKKMKTVSPNLSSLIGDILAARLIQQAGGLSRLSILPSSTIQILGAEKALFRALKTKTHTPKYGLIFNSSFISGTNKKLRGRISRYLSSKCAIASRIDRYGDGTTDEYGKALRKMVEKRIETGGKKDNTTTDMVLAKVHRKLKKMAEEKIV